MMQRVSEGARQQERTAFILYPIPEGNFHRPLQRQTAGEMSNQSTRGLGKYPIIFMMDMEM